MKKQIQKRFGGIAFLMLLVTMLPAQLPLELSAYVTAGSAKLNYTAGAKSEGSLGLSAGGNITVWIEKYPDVGVMSGLGIGYFTGTSSISSFSTIRDKYENGFLFINDYVDYSTRVRAYYIHVPLMGTYRLVVGDHDLFAAAGIKLGFDIYNSYNLKASNLTRRSSFPSMGMYFTNMPAHGFDVTTGHSVPGKNKSFGLDLPLAFEVGMCWNLSRKLYTTFFLDYGLTDIKPPELNEYMSKIKTSTFGLKLRIEL
ncbi:hypothetical protein FACS1894199_05490 [Bacteroidia bacterium]|nr:hypothetical protein FACS1894199_05490 [Bacteroidia bacterium]